MAESQRERSGVEKSKTITEGKRKSQELTNPAEDEDRVVRLKLKTPKKTDKQVAWSADTIDNENMNKKKSKCCCIYNKSVGFDESSSDTDDESENCRGHVERKKKKGNCFSPEDTVGKGAAHQEESPSKTSDVLVHDN